MKNILNLFFLLFNLTFFAQFSKTHYIPPVSSGSVTAGNQYLYISTPNVNPVKFTINQIGAQAITGTVSRDTPYNHFIGNTNDSQIHTPEDKVHLVQKNKGYTIEAEDLIAVSIRIRSNDKNHASSIVSKGIAALGKEFRIGAFLNDRVINYARQHYTFASILATENNTRIHFSDIKANSSLINNTPGNNTPSDIILNNNESFVIAVEGNTNPIPDALIGAKISADKPIAVNCGSFGGSNGDSSNLDMGFDQIVSAETIQNISPEQINGVPQFTEYIFIKSDGWDLAERALLIADSDHTEIYLNADIVPRYTLNKGQYIAIDGSNFTKEGNLYVKTSKNVFAYQSVGSEQNTNTNGSKNFANQELFFVPPISCQTPRSINNIPEIEKLGNDTFRGRITIVTQKGASLNFIVNGTNYTLANLPSQGIQGPFAVQGNPNYETYTILGLTGNISVLSTTDVYVAAYGNDGAATFGGYYSGFTFKPEISFNKVNINSTNCLPNIQLSINSATAFDSFQWYLNNSPINGATQNNFTPTTPGLYKVVANINSCKFTNSLESDNIPVSSCPSDTDKDGVVDNLDIDNDNDGITNCTESFGNQNIDTSKSTGTIAATTTSYTATTTAVLPIIGKSDGTIITEVPAGKTNSATYSLQFSTPLNIALEYPKNSSTSELFTDTSEYNLTCETTKTLSISNPNNQLLLDTNFDGIYESNVKEFSGFEIRFRLNSNTALQAGTGAFRISGNGISNIAIKHKNLSDTKNTKSSLQIYASCVVKDTDNDGIADQWDNDSDNDSIIDILEAQNNQPKTLSGKDTNQDGLDDTFEPGTIPQDTDKDLVADYIDYDSDNDGIKDDIEKNTDFDSDKISNYRDLDSDEDGCFDVKEAGFSDNDTNGILGISPVNVDKNGLVVGNGGYTNPNENYLIAAPITISTQPTTGKGCEKESTKITITSNAESYQWEISTDKGFTWNPILLSTVYTGSTTNTLTINGLSPMMKSHLFRVKLNRKGNSCDFYSNEIGLLIYDLPTLNSGKKLVQCTENTNGFSIFNLDQIKNLISNQATQETFNYYHSQNGALKKDSADEIKNFENYTNQVANSEIVWARVTNANNCFSIISFELYVSTAGADSFILPDSNLFNCDDYIDEQHNDYDGVSSFDLSKNYDYLTTYFNNSDIEIKFYKNKNDYFQETLNDQSLAISNNDFKNYRNIGYPFKQDIWVRIENKTTNECIGKPVTFNLIVEPTPNIDTNTSGQADSFICTDDPSFTINLNSGLKPDLDASKYTYVWSKDNNTLPYTTESITINTIGNYKVIVSNIDGLHCSKTRTIQVKESNSATLVSQPVVTDLVQNNTVTVSVTGLGNYVFSLDDPFSTTQSTGYFENLLPGKHKIYVIDTKGCQTLEVPFTILGFPTFFTPNGDGYNDNWNIIGYDQFLNKEVKILIFDRFGRLIKEILPDGIGWDGNYLGTPLPADDYWYTGQLADGRLIKGHFSLKR
ncbi:T9SS type B sorting domain-containing protein [Flavobacterium sp.]|uniref:T9SS type B sorting domain-containing protein n=1 Tax=Flavobacterium sp. TaxID=239 RepID=UPI003D14E4B2